MRSLALLFTGGNGPAGQFDISHIPSCSYVCAADSGIDLARTLGFTLDEAIGDFDSLASLDTLSTIPHITLNRHKDMTDTEAMLQHMREKGITSYVLVGGGEGRFDHLLHLYSLFSTYGPPEHWITAREHLYLVRAHKQFTIPPPTTISVIPALATGHSTVTSEHLFWELEDYSICITHQSISNICEQTTFSITVSGDPVFVSIPFP